LIWHSIHKYVGKPEVVAKNNGMEKDDIFQLGVMGLLKAVRDFDVNRGIKFSSYAVTAIYREVRCYIRDSSNIIRLSRTAYSLLNEIRKLEGELGYIPQTRELALYFNESEDKIVKALQIGKSVKYLDEAVTKSECRVSDTLKITDMLIDDDVNVEDCVLDRLYLENMLQTLNPYLTEVECKVLKGQLDGLTQAQISKNYRISTMKVSRSMKKIMALVQNYLTL
jgi:RNA polymerase sigma factor (sigma-70 family)